MPENPMRKSILLFAGASLLVATFAAGAAERCRYSAPRNAEIDAAGLQRLSVEIGPDNLVIRGEPGITKITVRGTACASDEKWLQDLKVETARQGDAASVVARDGNRGGITFSLFGGSYAYLKLDVRVPQSLAVKLTEGSGDADAGNLAALEASLGSGDLKVNGVAGEFALSVGSGDVVASDVGSLAISGVGSGDVRVDGVRGDAHAGSLGSGDLGLRNVKGKVSIGSVSSGDLKLADVGADVAVGSVGSGDVDIMRVGGNVRIDSVGSGDVDASDVSGNLDVDSMASGDIRHHGVKGKVSVPRTDD
jgi:DUF4097 and DUF4098 domain-containing protein YvlB